MNTTVRPTFLEFHDLCDVSRKPAFVSKLFLGVHFRSFVKLSMRESSKLDRVVKGIQHFTEQRTATPKTKECSTALLIFFIVIEQRRAASSSTDHSTTSGQTNPTFHRA